jgi:hypothetical protein
MEVEINARYYAISDDSGNELRFSRRGNKKLSRGVLISPSLIPGVAACGHAPCKLCYARYTVNRYKNVRARWGKNTTSLKAMLADDFIGLVDAFNSVLQLHVVHCAKRGIVPTFRWNVAGDFGMYGYWQLAQIVAADNPSVRFYGYSSLPLPMRNRPSNLIMLKSVGIISSWEQFCHLESVALNEGWAGIAAISNDSSLVTCANAHDKAVQCGVGAGNCSACIMGASVILKLASK